MQHYKIKTSDWVCAAISFLVSSSVHAGVPPINITLSSGSNIIAIGPGQTATVEYLIQDVIGRPPARTWLWTDPIPAYMSRTASLHQPDCSVYNQNPAIPNSFTLPPNGSCYFAMEVNGTILANQGGPTTYKPIFSNSAAVAYGPCDPLQLTPTPPPVLPGILLSAGSYLWDTDSPVSLPLLVSSRDQGATWVYPTSITALRDIAPFSNDGVINGTSCVGATCIAAGLAEDELNNTYAVLAVSQDSTLTWNYVTNITTPVFSPGNTNPYSTGGRLGSASCSGNTCIAGGQYQDSNPTARPFLAVSLNQGVFWIYPESITAPVFTPLDTNPFGGSGNFNSVSCSSPLCIAAGNYDDQATVTRPLLAMSQDAGATWTYPVSINEVIFDAINLNPFDNEGNLFGASCSGNTCVVAGSYDDPLVVTRPLLAFTNNGGNTWTYPTSVTAPVVVPTFASGQFLSASCSGTHCVAVGSYTDNVNVQHPLLAQSQDSGVTWTFPANIPVPVFITNPFVSGSFRSTSCSGNICIAAGTYADTNAVIRPLLALSQDGGITWTYPEIITAPVFTPGNSFPFETDGIFNAASCDGNTCIASGAYISVNSLTGTRPMLAYTTDGGVTWTYPNSITDPVFSPVDLFPYFAEGVFNAATATVSSFLPERLKFLYVK